jgi:hypothetical protein
MPSGYATLTAQWRSWLWENFSQSGDSLNGGPLLPWNNTVYNDNIYTVYEFDMQASLGLYVSMRLDVGNYTNHQQLAIRVYTMGWGPDAALIRMLEKANVTGSILSAGKGSWIGGYYKNRAPMLNYGEDVYFNASVSPRMANSSLREVNTYAMIGWEDSSTSIWMGGYQIPLGSHPDYIPTSATMTTYVSPFDKYYQGRNDIASGGPDKSYNWRGAGSVLFGVNATVTLVTPQVRNLSAYEAIIVDLNVLDGTNHSWLVGKEAKFGGQTLGMIPHVGTSMQTTAGKTTELNGLTYWGTVRLGKGSYPTTQVLAGYNAVTKKLNLSGGTTGLAMPLVYNVDYWGGDAGQNLVYTKSMPSIQLDVDPVDHWDVQVQPLATYMTLQNYWVKVTPHNASTTAYPGGAVPALLGTPPAGNPKLVNETVKFSTNNAGTTWPGNGSTILVTNTSSAWTTVKFGSVTDHAFVNVTGQWFNWTVSGSRTQATFGSAGPLIVVIPEFATVLIPIVGMMALFFVFRSRKRKREE